jgi:surface-anchored protein
MSSDSVLRRLARLTKGVGPNSHTTRKPARVKSTLARRSSFEVLENRRLFVSDLVNYLTTEHVDINIQRTGGQWAIGPRNDDAEIQYANDEAVMYVGKPALATRPTGAEYNFAGVGVGANFYVLPMSQNPSLLYQGFAAYGLEGQDVDRYNAVAESKGRVVSALASRWAKATLTGMRHTNPDGTTGAGQFSLWQTGSFGAPSVFMSSFNDGVANANTSGLDVTDGITTDDALWITRGGHLHYNFGFTQPGRYEVDLKLSAYFGDDGLTTPNAAGFSQSQDITIYFSVMSVGQLQFDASSYSVNEGAGTASINVVRVGGSDGRIAVNYATSNGTATAGSDYTSTTGSLEFLDGEITKSITIPILDDLTDEPNETVNLALNTAGPLNINEYLIDIEGDANGLLGSITTALLTIVDNDEPANTPPTISDVSDRSTDEDTPTGAIAFVVGDAQTAAGSLTVSATSSNTTLVPNANIVLGGSGANRTVTITPALNQFGSTTITVTVIDAGGLTATDTFLLTVNSINDLPTISDVGNQSTDEDTATGAIPFTVGDVETAAGALAVTAASSDQSLVPNANIVIGGSGANRTVTITPAANLSGSVTITLTVTDAGGLTATDNFVLTVGGVNDAPTISNVSDQSTNEDTPTGAIAFIVGDLETPAGSLVVTATSSNTTLVPNANIVLGGSGANRTVTITPVANLFGNTTITLSVTDAGGLSATDSFLLTVNAVNDLPTISDISNRFILEGNSTGAIPFTVGDIETAAADLIVTATSSNQAVVPNANIVLGGSGTNRTISLTSIANQVGASTITVTVTDASGGQASDAFVITVGDLVRATFDRSAVIANATQPNDVRLADIDNDGDLDVLFAKYITSISILRNNGNGTFGSEIALPALTVSDIHVADVNGDNLPDIVSSVYIDSTYAETAIAIWRNLGGGNFSGRELVESTRTTAYVGLTGVGDVDGDSLKDLVLSNDRLSWSRNQGDGTFAPIVTISTSGINYSSSLRDIDQDGDLDIVQATLANDDFKLQVFRNSGTTNPSFATEQVASFGSIWIGGITIGDTNEDGFADIHLLRDGSNRDILALHGTSTGTFLAPTVLGSGPDLTDLKIGDIDGDGRPDLALTAREQNKVHFAQNVGSGNFTALQEFTHDGSSLNPYPETVAIGDIDLDGRNDLVFSERFGTGIAWSRNRSEENITKLTPPASRTYLNGYPMTFDVFLGFNAQINTTGGSPTLPITIGSQVVQVPYVGQPNANVLRFRYQVQSTDLDLDGIQVATSVTLNGAVLTDVHNRSIDASFVQFAGVNTSGILVNGGAPYVTGITRLDANPATSPTVRFGVTFSEVVTGVTNDDFALDANGPTGATITSVTGSGSSYVVTASIGTGDGTLRLRVLDNDSIVDTDSYQLGGVGLGNGEFAYGQGYTIRTSTATPTFNNVVTDGHLDVVLQVLPGDWYGFWYGAGWWETADTLISAGPEAKAIRPTGATWDFLGASAGEPVWIFPETFSATTPWPGVGAYFNNAGDFASYFEADPRVNGTAPWIKMQLLDVRGPEGGEFSLYQSGITAPNVFMTSANGIGPEDAAWIPNLDHIHYNWAFSKPGLYQVDIAASGYIDANQSGTYEPGIDPLSESQIITLHFGVELKPTISDISNRFVVEGNSTPAIPFTVTDVETPAADLVVTATSSNQSVIPNGNIILGGSGEDRTISSTSVLDQIGSTTITVTVTDAGGLQTVETFVLTVTANGLVPFAAPNLLPPGLGVASNSVVADFNGDGKLDLITSGSGVEQLGYRQGLGGGNFLPEQGLNLGSGQRSGGLNTIDYDNDGDMDFVAAEAPSASSTSTQLVLYRNNGTASFTRNVLMSSNAAPSFFQLFPGDLNGDGRVDLVFRKGATSAVYALQQTDGSFGAEVTLATSPSNAFPRLADMDNDGDLDVVVGNYATSGSGTITVFKNNGSGTFIASPSFNGGVSPNVLSLTDMNGDGLRDIVSSQSTNGSRAGYYPQLADGTFSARVNVMTAITALNSIEVADINGDAIPDIIAGVNLSGNVLAWSPGLGDGSYGTPVLMDPAQGQSFGVYARDLDGDSHLDLISMGNLVTRPSPIVVHINKTGENPMVLLPPQSLRYVSGDQISMSVYFGFPVTVTGTPRIALQLGASTVYANYVSGSGTATLRFRYTVASTDLDLDGVQLVSNLIDLNGGTITNPIGGAGVLEFPNMTFNGVTVNGRGPLVQGITRLDPTRSTNAGTVRFQLQFAEPVTGVDVSDFNVVMNAGDLAGASVLSVTGSGAVYDVTVGTGTGSGTLGLGVKESAGIFDLSGDVLAKGYVGGEVYTIRPEAIGEIDTFYTNGHADYRPVYSNGQFSHILDLDPGVLPQSEYRSDSVYTYADSSALVNRPTGASFDFLGVAAGQPLYVLPAAQNPALPYFGWGDRIDRGVFASYLPADSRVTSAASYVKLEMVGMRSSSGGHFSVYQIVVGPNTPRTWMATSDGISSNDAMYLSVGGHLHREVTFSKPGIYEVDVVISGFLDTNGNGTYDPIIDQYTESGIKTMVFNVDTLGARDDAFQVNDRDMLYGSVTLNDDWDEGIGAYSASVQATTTKGALSLQPNGSFTYQPSATFAGTDSFTYRLTNPRGGFTTATVTITGSTRPDFDATLRTGHADIGVNFEDDVWDLHIHQHEPDTEYEPSEAKFYVGRDAMLTRTGDSSNAAYDFLGTPAGSTLFVLPEVENPNLLFLGIGGEELADGLLDGDVATLRLASVSGPGHFSMWQAGLTATTPKLYMATSDGIDGSDAFVVEAGSHAHMNFAFTKQGFYEVTFVASGVDADGNATDSGQVTYYFYVSDGLAPFARPTEHGGKVATEAGPVVSADFTGDGKVDVITAGFSSGSLSFLQGTGDGSFLTERGLNVGSAFRSWTLSAVDFDTDGKVDLVTTEFSTTTGEIVVYKNDGTGNFTRTVLASGLPLISRSSVGDLNGDGRPDIVYFKNNTTLGYQRGNASGGLDPESVVSSSFSSATSLALADVNADGRLDIIAADATANRIRVFNQNSSGLFDLSSEVVVASGVDLKQVVDLNGDGRLDLLTTDTDSASLNKAGYYAQLPSGLFGPRVNLPIYGQGVNSLRAADFNLDGVIDIAFGNLFFDEVAFSFFNFDVGWLLGQGAGAYGPSIFLKTYGSRTGDLITPDLDGDLDPDIVIGGAQSAVDSETLYAFVNQSGENPMVLIPPAAHTRTAGDPIDLQVYFGFPITVTGTPQIALQLGANTVYANYIGGTGTPTLRFRYIVTATDMDLDGVQLASNLIGLNGGTMKDPLNGNAVLEFPNLAFSGVIVNGAGPLVQSVTRLDARSTAAPTVQFQVTFAEPVTGVDVADFDVAMKEGNLAGASVQSVSGAGNTYQVTVSTGVGSGTLGLNVKGSASIFDLNGDVLGKGFAGGQVYTVRRQAIGDIDNYYTHGHADYRPTLNNGAFSWILNPDPGLIPGSPFASEEVISYLDSTSIVTRPAAATYNFLGVPAGAPLYLSNSSGNLQASVPYLGFSGESIPAGTFAAYNPADPRMAATPRDYMKVEMVGMRSSSGGDFSLYSVLFSGAVRLWMASSDGLSSTDNIWLRSAAHSHFNTAFSKPGKYEIDVVVSGFLDSNGNGVYDPIVDPYVESGIKTMVFHVDTLGARNDAFNVNGQEMLRGSVTLNDQWDDGIGTYAASVQTTTTKGALSLQPNGSFTYQPSATFGGSDSFTYRLTNERGGFTTATVTITGSTRPNFVSVQKTGHADIGVNFEDDAWDLHIHDHEPDTEYEPSEALLYVGADARTIRVGDSANAAFDFLGVPVGSAVFVLPQVENNNLLYLGIGGEELADGLLAGDVARLRLAAVSGPGQFSIWQSGLTPTTPKRIMATSDGIDASDSFDVAAGSHAHANFAFTKIGFYEVTFVAMGVDADGNATDSGQVTYYFQVGNAVDGLDVQNGQVQRSFVRNVDVLFGQDDNLGDLLAAGRVQVTKFDLNGENPVLLAASAFSAGVAGNRLRLDFGANGIGGNRNTDAGDGYYRVGIDIDGDGTADAFKHFYRLLGDVNGDRSVNALDRLLVMRGNSPGAPSVDTNGDGVVNAVDVSIVTRGLGKRLKNGLWVDD